jgi:hypothetical protein
MFDRIKDGVDQIGKSPANVGCVLLNLKNVIDHNVTWPLENPEEVKRGEEPRYVAWHSEREPEKHLLQTAIERERFMFDAVGEEAMLHLFEKKAIPGALAFLQTGTSVVSQSGPMMTTLGLFFLMNHRQSPPSAEQQDILRRLNNAMHHR